MSSCNNNKKKTKRRGQLDATATITPETDPRVTHWIGDWVSHHSSSGRFGEEQSLLQLLTFLRLFST